MTSSGCVSLGDVISTPNALESLASAAPPQRRAGDSIHYSSGRSERVQQVADGVATIRRSNNITYGLEREQLLIESFRETSSRQYLTRILESEGNLWPLQVGNKQQLLLEVDRRSKQPGVELEPRTQYWSCEVDSAERVTVSMGSFDAFKISCLRATGKRSFRQRIHLYYAPALEQVVLRVDQGRYGAPTRLEVTAFEPSLERLSKQSRARFTQNFQRVLENLPSGKTSDWRSAAHQVTISITPVKTFRESSGRYCRTYRMTVASPGDARDGGGLVCRTSDGRWLVPETVSSG